MIPPDRFVNLQLPPHLPEGRAILTVWADDSADDAHHAEADPDHQDIEWFEEFDEDEEDDAGPPG